MSVACRFSMAVAEMAERPARIENAAAAFILILLVVVVVVVKSVVGCGKKRDWS